VVLVVTVRLPLPPPVAAQLTENAVLVVVPAVTETVRGLEPLTVQFVATPLNATEWLPAESPVNVTLPLIPMARPEPPSTLTL
jgi:hypothetical protein